jgi:uncharacterized protein YjiS (DUF1127 family)
VGLFCPSFTACIGTLGILAWRPVSSIRTSRAKEGVGTRGTVVARWHKMRERRRVIRELQDASDRELADIRLSRHDIPRVFDPEFAREWNARGV